MRPIDADAITYCAYDLDDYHFFRAVDEEAIAEMPTLTLDGLRPNGHWNVVEFDKDSRRITIECSECGMVEEMTVMAYGFGHNFCHSCGADMRGGGEDG